LLPFILSSIFFHTNMISKANYTGFSLLKNRPKIYRAIANYLAEGFSVHKITKLCNCHTYSVKAVEKREAERIEQKKKQLANLFANVAQLSAERVEEMIGKAGVRDAIVGSGVATDKLLAILGQTPVAQIAIVNMPSDAERLKQAEQDRRLDAIAARIRELPAPSQAPT
jgi:hypothetical protein